MFVLQSWGLWTAGKENGRICLGKSDSIKPKLTTILFQGGGREIISVFKIRHCRWAYDSNWINLKFWTGRRTWSYSSDESHLHDLTLPGELSFHVL